MAGIMPRQNRLNPCKDIDRCGMSSFPPQLVPETASLKILCQQRNPHFTTTLAYFIKWSMKLCSETSSVKIVWADGAPP